MLFAILNSQLNIEYFDPTFVYSDFFKIIRYIFFFLQKSQK